MLTRNISGHMYRAMGTHYPSKAAARKAAGAMRKKGYLARVLAVGKHSPAFPKSLKMYQVWAVV